LTWPRVSFSCLTNATSNQGRHDGNKKPRRRGVTGLVAYSVAAAGHADRAVASMSKAPLQPAARESPARWETKRAEMASQGEHKYKVTPHASTPLIRITRWSPSRPFLGGPAINLGCAGTAALRKVSRSIELNHGTADHLPLSDNLTGGADPVAAFRSES